MANADKRPKSDGVMPAKGRLFLRLRCGFRGGWGFYPNCESVARAYDLAESRIVKTKYEKSICGNCSSSGDGRLSPAAGRDLNRFWREQRQQCDFDQQRWRRGKFEYQRDEPGEFDAQSSAESIGAGISRASRNKDFGRS